MADIPTLETPRLRLRAHGLEDFDAYAEMWTEAAVIRYIGGVPLTREASWSRFLRHVGVWHHLGFGFFAIEDKATGQFAGECGFHDLHRAIEPSLEGTMETGWALRPAFHGKGMAREAVEAALAWAAVHGKHDRLTAIIDRGNNASLGLAAKLGFLEFARSPYAGQTAVMLERPRRA